MPILKLKDKQYLFDVGDFTNLEGMQIEKATGLSWQEFLDQAGTSLLATTALVWMIRRRDGETALRFDDVAFPMSELQFDLDDEQKRALAAQQEGEGNPPAGGAEPPSDLGGGPAPSSRRKPSTGSSRAKSSG